MDIENLAGTALPTLGQVSQVQGLYIDRLGLRDDDQVVMAASHRGLLNAALGWPHARYRVRSGPNGADLELIDVLLHEDIPSRFTHVVIGSGDGRFGPPALLLAAGGVRVTVVSRTGSLSHLLRRAASDIVYLDVPRPRAVPLPAAAQCSTGKQGSMAEQCSILTHGSLADQRSLAERRSVVKHPSVAARHPRAA